MSATAKWILGGAGFLVAYLVWSVYRSFILTTVTTVAYVVLALVIVYVAVRVWWWWKKRRW